MYHYDNFRNNITCAQFDQIQASKFCAQQICKKGLLSDKVYNLDADVFPTVI